MAAEIMAVEPESIRLTTADTDTTFPCMGTFGSRVTFCAGSAVTQAANGLKQQLLENAADLLEANQDDLEMKDRKVFVKGSPEKALSYAEIGAAAFFKKKEPLAAHGYYNGPEDVSPDFDPKTYFGYPAPAMVFGTHLAEVEVDPATGKVEVLNFTAAHDLGRAINPLLVEGQIEGGAAQGIGWSLMEDVQFENGEIVNPNFVRSFHMNRCPMGEMKPRGYLDGSNGLLRSHRAHADHHWGGEGSRRFAGYIRGVHGDVFAFFHVPDRKTGLQHGVFK